jgi:hypothetical protein
MFNYLDYWQNMGDNRLRQAEEDLKRFGSDMFINLPSDTMSLITQLVTESGRMNLREKQAMWRIMERYLTAKGILEAVADIKRGTSGGIPIARSPL